MTQIADMLLEQTVQGIVDEIEPEQVIFFGSRARGDEREDSDARSGSCRIRAFWENSMELYI